MDTKASVIEEILKDKKRIKKIENDDQFSDFVGDVLYKAVPDLEELKYLLQKYDLLIFIVEEGKITIRFQKEKTNPNQKKKTEAEMTQSVPFDNSLSELVAMIRCSLKNTPHLGKPREFFHKEKKKASIHLLISIK